MNPTLKRYLLSALTTFITMFSATLVLQINSGMIEWTATFWFSILIVAIRAGVKAVVEAWAGQHADNQLP